MFIFTRPTPPGPTRFKGAISTFILNTIVMLDVIAEKLGTLLWQLVNPMSISGNDNRVIQYSPSLRLSFSLLNEDIHTSRQRGWAAEKNINGTVPDTQLEIGLMSSYSGGQANSRPLIIIA
ncbi:hypothetical protein FRC18_003375 [Serendipita sp. 400]|nr:hypothetical protein FRC18_003375 [Serendipita sp. 400]